MIDTSKLAEALGEVVRPARKTANAINTQDGITVLDNPDLQKMVGDPDDVASRTFTQFAPNPGTVQTPDPLSPIQGDYAFFYGFQPGARFEDKTGAWWHIDGIDWSGGPSSVEITNVWYPRISATVSVADVRRSIFAWIEPFYQIVPEAPAGVDYEAVPVRVV